MLKDRKLRQRVEKFLVKFPHCRDDDHRLIANVWQDQLISKYGLEQYQKMAGVDFLADFAKHQLSSPESIRRTRQKIQELQPLLRGNNYHKRQRHQSQIKQEIRAFR